MDLSYRKSARIVAIIETVLTVVLGITALILGIIGVLLNNTPENNSTNPNYDALFIIMIASGLAISFSISLGLVLLLWKAILEESFIKCTIWYITQSVLISLELLFLIGICFFGLFSFFYILRGVSIMYRLWTIHIVKSFGEIVLLQNGIKEIHSRIVV